jgi:hypothetical protein
MANRWAQAAESIPPLIRTVALRKATLSVCLGMTL